jgi:hypothetical protein
VGNCGASSMKECFGLLRELEDSADIDFTAISRF